MSVRARIAILVALALASAPLAAQAPAAAGAGRVPAWAARVTVGRMEHRVDAGFGVGAATGTVLGLAAHVGRWQPIELDVHALGGQLQADTVALDDIRLGEVGLRASMLPMPWVAIVTTATMRGYDAAPSKQQWTMLGAGAELRLALLDGRVRTLVRTTLLPYVAVSGREDPDLGLANAAGLQVEHRRMHMSLEYSLERYLFPSAPGSDARREQLSSLQLAIGASW